jgi:hypothetical protein
MCNGGRHRYETWEPETYEEPYRGDLRVSDAERDEVVEALRGHAQAGRLTSDELEERVALALKATTRDDLAALQRDLPVPARRAVSRPRARRPAYGYPPFVPLAILLVLVWAVSGAGSFWPLWPLLFFGFMALRRGTAMGHTRVTGNNRRTW